VAETATTDEVKKAFRALAREVHPDVAGDDPAVVDRFKVIRHAYEVLVDPKTRQRYDRRRKGPSRPPPGRFGFQSSTFTARQTNTAHTQSRSDMDLEDIFNDHGGILDFGFGTSNSGGATSAPTSQSRRRPPPPPQPGADVVLSVQLGRVLADTGGTVRLDYSRLVRTDDGKAIRRVNEVHHLRIAPRTSHGDTLRVPRLGDAGAHGGPYGDLVCDVRVVYAQEAPSGAKRGKPSSAQPVTGDPLVVSISIAECVLGGQIAIQTPQGQVRVRVPPCTPGGSRLRLRGKGCTGDDGEAQDLVVQLRVVPPSLVDDESRELIARFAELNPQDPREP
jgi:DnaJ-class molecular chaperone